MKNLSFSGVRFPLLLLTVFLVIGIGCGGKPTPTPPPPPPPPPPAAVINLPAPPTTPLWFGGSYSGAYSVNNAPLGSVLYIDGVLSPTSGTISRNNLQSSITINAELRKSSTDPTLLTNKNLFIWVCTEDQTNIERYGSWREYREQEDTTVGLTGIYHEVSVPICNQDDTNTFNNKTGLCTTNAGAMTCGVPQTGQSQFIFQTVGNVKKLEWANADPSGWYTIVELTSTSMVLTKNVFSLGRNRYINVKYFYQH